MFKEFDTVVLAETVPGAVTAVGAVGAIVDVLRHPQTAYLVEFCNDDGETLEILSLLPAQVALKTPAHPQRRAA